MVFRKVLNNNLQPTRKTTQLNNIIKSVLLLIMLAEVIPGFYYWQHQFWEFKLHTFTSFPNQYPRHTFQTKRNSVEALVACEALLLISIRYPTPPAINKRKRFRLRAGMTPLYNLNLFQRLPDRSVGTAPPVFPHNTQRSLVHLPHFKHHLL